MATAHLKVPTLGTCWGWQVASGGRAVRLAPGSNWAPVAPLPGFENGVYFARPLGWAGLLLARGGVCMEVPHCGTG